MKYIHYKSYKNLKLTPRQMKELRILDEYIPKRCCWKEIVEEDIKRFFEWSEKGLYKKIACTNPVISKDFSGFNALCWGKKWRERERAGL